MIIEHPLLGPRDVREFVYLGDAALLDRPDPDAFDTRAAAIEAFHDHLYLRDNPAGTHDELWFHEQGDRSWLVVTRDTVTHAISRVRLAREVALERATRRSSGESAGAAPSGQKSQDGQSGATGRTAHGGDGNPDEPETAR